MAILVILSIVLAEWFYSHSLSACGHNPYGSIPFREEKFLDGMEEAIARKVGMILPGFHMRNFQQWLSVEGMDANYFPVSMGDYYGFQAIDRALYTLLAVEFWHDPLVCVQILAFWMWLEQLGFKNVVQIIFSLPHALINEFVDEALTGLNCINNPETLLSLEAMDLPLTSRFLKRKICLRLLIRNRGVALCGIRKMVEICATVLDDEIQDAIKKHTARDMLNNMTLSHALEESLINGFANFGFGVPCNRNVIPPATTVMPVNRGVTSRGNVSVRLQSGQSLSQRFSNSGLPREILHRSLIPTSPLPPEERSMFITFSKGYPVSEAELTEFFTMVFGDCIDSFLLQQVNPGEQALYARVAFRLPLVIDLVLNGLPKAKFTINGKHLWMRKFIPRYHAKFTSSSATANASANATASGSASASASSSSVAPSGSGSP